jgi:hypothetical protein
VQWTPGGVAVCADPSHQESHVLTTDSAGGAIIAWSDYRNSNVAVYSQRVAVSGTTSWTPDGVRVSTASGRQYDPQITYDGAGGAFITWEDERSGADIYVQRLLATGSTAPGWASSGLAVGYGPLFHYEPCITSDTSGGAIIAWVQGEGRFIDGPVAQGEYRAASTLLFGYAELYAQQVKSNGTVADGWPPNGDSVCPGFESQEFPAITTDGSGGAILAWEDYRNGNEDIYAQRMRTTTATWYLAEGTTAWGFETYVTIENPNPMEVTARVSYVTPDGPVPPRDITLAAMSQTTVDPRWDLTYNTDFSTKVECLESLPIGVDRTMYWTGPGAPSPEAHSSIGVNAPADAWYFAEGCSAYGFECWLTIQNPNPEEATCTLTYMIEGGAPQNFMKKVPANTRQSFNMADDVGSKNASILVKSDIPIVPERSMYRNNRREGHESVGTTTPSNNYYLAEGTTAYGFTSYVCVQNPNDSPCFVSLTYMTPDGPDAQSPISMPAYSRATIKVNDQLENSDFSTVVHSDVPIIAERAMYWGAGTPLGEACHDTIGMSSARKIFYLPDGQCSEGRETYTTVQNPNEVDVVVEISYLTPTGVGNQVFTDTIPAQSRKTYSMADKLPSGRAAIKVESKTAGKPIMAERSMYWNSRGVGTCTIGGSSY